MHQMWTVLVPGPQDHGPFLYLHPRGLLGMEKEGFSSCPWLSLCLALALLPPLLLPIATTYLFLVLVGRAWG